MMPNWADRFRTPGELRANPAYFVRLSCLAGALAGALIAAYGLTGFEMRQVYRAVIVVDITRSMNVRDYTHDARTESRLEFVKRALKRAARDLPCGSQLGLGLFTDRRTALLFEPFDVCRGYAVFSAAVEQLDWRMAWAADSRIADGLYDALKVVPDPKTVLAFLTDGHEAPPRNPRYNPPLGEFKGQRKGIIGGIGGLTLAPIPKFNEKGEQTGFFAAEEVPHHTRFGLPNQHPTEIEGYHERNAPFGSNWDLGSEHLSSLKEDYLRTLASEAQLAYLRLERHEDLTRALTLPPFAHEQRVPAELSAWPAGFALVSLLLALGAQQLARLVVRLRIFSPSPQ